MNWRNTKSMKETLLSLLLLLLRMEDPNNLVSHSIMYFMWILSLTIHHSYSIHFIYVLFSPTSHQVPCNKRLSFVRFPDNYHFTNVNNIHRHDALWYVWYIFNSFRSIQLYLEKEMYVWLSISGYYNIYYTSVITFPFFSVLWVNFVGLNINLHTYTNIYVSISLHICPLKKLSPMESPSLHHPSIRFPDYTNKRYNIYTH